MVTHDPSGCVGNYVYCDEPRWYHDPQPVFSSCVGELEIISGDSAHSISLIENAVREFAPPFVCILSSPVPALVGCDVTSMAASITDSTGVPCFGIETEGFQYYHKGVEKAMALLVDRFADKRSDSIPHTINILGMTPLDYGDISEFNKLCKVLNDFGWNVNCAMGFGDSLDSVKKLRSAEKNIVMSMGALPLAKKLERENGTPFFVGPPCGKSGLAALNAFLSGDTYEFKSGTRSDRLLLVGEQCMMNALRRALREEENYKSIDVATFFAFSPEYAEAGDCFLPNEDAFHILLEKPYDIVVADPIFRNLSEQRHRFVELPHPASGSRLSWKHCESLIGMIPAIK